MRVRCSNPWDKNNHCLQQVVEQKILDISEDRRSNDEMKYFMKHYPTHPNSSECLQYILKGHNIIIV